MSGPTAPTPPPSSTRFVVAHPDHDPLRVVLFGMPDAGKSSLLGALAQSTQSQDRTLQGRLLDLTHGLNELWRRVYENRPRETLDEIVPYPVYFERFTAPISGKQRLPVMLYDCDGRVANELLSHRKPLERSVATGGLAQAVLDADALVLAIDASANDQQVDQDFREFVAFLKTLESHRSHDHAVGGLPVHLVLTKCDLLARDPIDRTEWERRLAVRKKQVADRFREFLKAAQAGAEKGFTFGSVDLHVHTTAVKRPALKEAPAQPREPLGVAELFRDCFEHADKFRDVVRRADRRLRWTVLGAAGFVALLAIGAILLFGFGGPTERPPSLERKLEQYQAREGTPAKRLASATLDERMRELGGLRDDPGFHELPPEKQQFIRRRIDEIQAYQKFREAMTNVPAIEDARSLEALNTIRKKIEGDTPLPTEFSSEWDAPHDAPEAVVDRRQRLEQLRQRIDGVEKLRSFFNTRKNEGNDLLFDPKLDPSWNTEVLELLDRAKTLPFPRSDPQRGAVYEFDEVVIAQRDWEKLRDRLQRFRDLSAALGMVGSVSGTKAPYALTDPGPEADINALATARLRVLQQNYPDYRSWSLAEVPDKAMTRLKDRITAARDQSVADGQRLILQRIRQLNPIGPELTRDWEKIAEWLLSPSVQEWRELNRLLTVLLDPTSEDPTTVTAGFLRKKAFVIEIHALRIRIPDNLRDKRLVPATEWKLYYQANVEGGPLTPVTFKLDGDSTREGGNATIYSFLPAEGSRAIITYSPGDLFFATLNFKEADKEWRLTWTRSRSKVYQFERLVREPRLHEATQPPESGDWARGITVTVEKNFPVVPPLIPAVLFEKK